MTFEEFKQQLISEKVTDPREINRRIAEAVTTGVLNAEPKEPELTDEQTAKIITEPREPELTAEESEQRLTPRATKLSPLVYSQKQGVLQPMTMPTQPNIVDVVKQMAYNYSFSPSYKQQLDEEATELDDQISQLIQRRNLIQIARQEEL